MKMYQFLTSGFLVVALIIYVVINDNRHAEEKQQNLKDKNELQFELDSLKSFRENSTEQRDSLLLLVDNLNSRLQIDSAVIASKDYQIKLLSGKYDKVPQDSLGILMDRKAGN